MDIQKKKIILSILFFFFILCTHNEVYADNGVITDHKASVFISPRTETVLVGSTFDVSIFLNTHGSNINTVELDIKFPPDKLSIVRPSGGKSFISIWLEPASYSNTDGTARFVGVIPNGITTESGLVSTITFKTKSVGSATVDILPSSKVLANNGFGTNIISGFGRSVYNINPKPPEGVKVFSETHQFEHIWYNNNNPVLAWERESDVTDFSFEIDNKPFTVPDNKPDSEENVIAYENLEDGLHYFHIKARKKGIWGSATHFLLHIDTTPPARFTPTTEALTATVISRVLVSFFTTDSQSGMDHYEVGVIDKSRSPLESPVFVEAESPYQLPNNFSESLLVIVRAMDRAGNVRDESITVAFKFPFTSYVKNNAVLILTLFIVLILGLGIVHYVYGHRIMPRLKKIVKIIREEEQEDKQLDKEESINKNEYNKLQ